MRRRPRRPSVLLCPKCGSSNVVMIAGSIVGQVYHCKACDYVGSLILETDIPEEGSLPKDP